MNMTKVILLVILVSLPFNLLSNEISWPFLHASDYYRGTAGERLMFINHDKKVGTIYIYNDLRHYNFKDYFDIHHKKREVYGYKRTINIFSLNYIPLRNLILSVRVPYVNANNKWNFQYTYTNSGMSDVFIGASYRFLHRNGKEVYFSTGLKLPTGRNYHNTRKIPISTGSYDVPFMIYTNFSFHNIVNYLDFGLIVNGDSDEYPFDSNRKENNGKELFFDYAIAKKISRFSLISEINYFYIFDIREGYFDDTTIQFVTNTKKYKLSIVPGVLAEITKDMRIEIGYSIDLTGRDVYSGNSIVFRLFYNF